MYANDPEQNFPQGMWIYIRYDLWKFISQLYALIEQTYRKLTGTF